jgi:ribosomal protein S7
MSLTLQKILYKKFLGSLIKNGNKALALKILEKSLLTVSLKNKVSIDSIFKDVLNKLICIFEIRKIRKRRNMHLVPFPVSPKRREYLKIK